MVAVLCRQVWLWQRIVDEATACNAGREKAGSRTTSRKGVVPQRAQKKRL